MSQSSATFRDLASHAGVSIGTVSRVLNGKSNIRPESRARVLEAAKELGYKLPKRRPFGSGRKPVGRRTGDIGFLMAGRSSEWAQHPLFHSYLRGISLAYEQAQAEGRCGVLHLITEFGDRQDRVINLVRDKKIDGLIISGNPGQWLGTLSDDLPVVLLNSLRPELTRDQVMCDDHMAGYCVTQKLWEMGHRRIAFATNDSLHAMLVLRHQGCEAFLRLQNARDPALSYVGSGVAKDSGPMQSFPNFDDAVDTWWALPQERRPTAIIAANDWSAAGIYKALSDRSIRVPDDVSVVGFDNLIVICESLSPSLSSYEVPVEEAAATAARILIDRIYGESHAAKPDVRLVRGQLVMRQSVRQLTPSV